MKKSDFSFFVIFWLLCGFVGYGLTLGYDTHQWPDQDNVGFSVFIGAAGPFGMVASLCLSRPYHWRLKPFTTEERWKAFHESAPHLSREYFEQNYN